MFKIHAFKSHPRYWSNYYRDLLANGVRNGLTSLQGLIAYGRGEAFDYLLGEKTHHFAEKAIEASACLLILAEYPVLCVNGNTAVLVPKEYIELIDLLPAKFEVNLFHTSKQRELKIKKHLLDMGAKDVLLSDKALIKGIESNRRFISSFGQKKGDVIFVPLEDGDRTEGLKRIGKKVITVDLNPLSRTAQAADITIVDNIIRAMPLLIKHIKKYKTFSKERLKKRLVEYNNQKILKRAEDVYRRFL